MAKQMGEIKVAKHQRPDAAPWSDETIAKIRQMAADGLSTTEAADKLGILRCTLRYRATLVMGIKFNSADAKARAFERAASVLHEHYGKHLDSREIYRLYVEKLGWECSMKSMHHHAHRLGVTRGAEALSTRSHRAVAQRIANQAAARIGRAAALQSLIDTGLTRTVAGRQLGFGQRQIASMLRDGLITIPPRMPKIKPPPKPRIIKIKPPPAPRPVPVVYIAPPPPPPPPLPPPAENGKIYAGFRAICGWADARGIYYDGRQIDKLNAIRAAAKLPLLVQDEGVTA